MNNQKMSTKTIIQARSVQFLDKNGDTAQLEADNEVIDVRYFPLASLPGNIRPHLSQQVEDFQAYLPNAIVRIQ